MAELDQLLEDAPLPFIMQHAVKISVVRKRVSSLNMLLKSIQRRLDNVDRMLSVGLLQGFYLPRFYMFYFLVCSLYESTFLCCFSFFPLWYYHIFFGKIIERNIELLINILEEA